MPLFEVALGFKMDGRIRVRRAVAFGGTRRVHAAELSLNQFQYLFVSDVAGGGDHQMVRREPLSKTRAQRIAIESFHGFRGAENRAAEGMFRPQPAPENPAKHTSAPLHLHLHFLDAAL